MEQLEKFLNEQLKNLVGAVQPPNIPLRGSATAYNFLGF